MISSNRAPKKGLDLLLGEKVAKVALGEVGVTEIPMGSNTGPKVRSYQMATDLGGTGWPWCGAFVAWCYKMAHCPDDNLTSPSTAVTYQRAKSQGAILAKPRVGAMILWPGVHIGLIVEDLGGGLVRTVEGNSSDSVRIRTRRVGDNGSIVVAPQVIRKSRPAPAPRMYYIERLDAKPRLVGPWRTKAARDHAYNRLKPNAKKMTRKVRIGRNKYAMSIGSRRIIGPWVSKKSRDNIVKRLRAKGERVRPFSRARKRSAAVADELGKVN